MVEGNTDLIAVDDPADAAVVDIDADPVDDITKDQDSVAVDEDTDPAAVGHPDSGGWCRRRSGG